MIEHYMKKRPIEKKILVRIGSYYSRLALIYRVDNDVQVLTLTRTFSILSTSNSTSSA